MTGDPERFARLLVQRAPVLHSLDGANASKAELADDLGVSRSTVDRAVRDLESVYAVERRDGTVTLTLVGRLALTAYDAFQTDLRSLTGCDGLTHLDADTPVTLDVVRGATTVTASPGAPHQPVSAFVDFVEDAVHVELYATMVLPTVVDAIARRIEEGLTVDAYLNGAALDALLADHSETATRVLDSSRVTVAETAADYCFDFARFDLADGRQVTAIAYGAHGVDELLVNDTADALAWAQTRLDALEDDATVLT
ncbi:GntR family transcriptional regulator [Halarchaeum sp. CBA1220]|uniref:helix-turn-helix transcriptional regulator n=1 Tax=Halarchaeum sp. CBA1220 TaxID=1853682 RepID=UPI000F3A91EA|nr:HTH domain-containing protein [Halarchaeum sp. CBA1220]QLC34013.1 GntR family transcriptional regulator [Halarchaeum sp. CBA1220]